MEKENFVQVNNQLNLPSSNSSSTSSSSSSARCSKHSTDFIISAPLTSAVLIYSVQANLIIDVYDNNDDVIHKLLKEKNKFPVYIDRDFVIYSLLSQLNPQRWGGYTLADTYDPFNLLNNYNLQG
jgi:hypothetical protein